MYRRVPTYFGIALLLLGITSAQCRAQVPGSLVDLALIPSVSKELGLQDTSPEVAELRKLKGQQVQQVRDAMKGLRDPNPAKINEAMSKLGQKLRTEADPQLRKLLS